eukprot:s3602_g5.t1
MDTSRELWRLKEAVPEMIWTLISPVLAQSTPDPQDLAKLKGEFDGCMRPENLQGIFPVGSPWSSAETVDLKFKPGLPALRFNHLLSTIIGPALKGSRTVEEANAQNSIQLWVPLPSAVLKKRKRRSTIIGPALKGSRTVEEANAQNSIQLWVPLPSAVLKKRKRRADADDGGKGGHPKGAGKGRGGGKGSADGGGGGAVATGMEGQSTQRPGLLEMTLRKSLPGGWLTSSGYKRLAPALCPVNPEHRRWFFARQHLRCWKQLFEIMGMEPWIYLLNGDARGCRYRCSQVEEIFRSPPRGTTPMDRTLNEVLQDFAPASTGKPLLPTT